MRQRRCLSDLNMFGKDVDGREEPLVSPHPCQPASRRGSSSLSLRDGLPTRLVDPDQGQNYAVRT